MIDDKLVDTSAGAYSPGWYAAAASGKIAAVTSASWGDALIESVQGGKGKWKVAPMQKWGADGFGSSAIGGSTAAVLANAKHPKEALEFITWMTTSKEGVDAMIKHCGIGWSPAATTSGRSASSRRSGSPARTTTRRSSSRPRRSRTSTGRGPR